MSVYVYKPLDHWVPDPDLWDTDTVENFRPDQARDAHGRFSKEEGASAEDVARGKYHAARLAKRQVGIKGGSLPSIGSSGTGAGKKAAARTKTDGTPASPADNDALDSVNKRLDRYAALFDKKGNE